MASCRARYAHLDVQVVQVRLEVGILKTLCPDDMSGLPTSAHKLRFDMDTVSRGDSNVDITIRAHTRGIVARRKWLHFVFGDASRRGLARAVGDNLKKAGYEPVLVDGVVGLDGHDVETDVVWVSVRQDRHEWRQVEEVGRQVQGAI